LDGKVIILIKIIFRHKDQKVLVM